MTTDDARELYLKSDCSYFIMCTYYYSGYMQYRQFDPPKTLESLWKNEKLRMLQKEMQKTGDYRLFARLYDIDVTFREYSKLLIMMDALKQMKEPLAIPQRMDIVELIVGKKNLKARGGLIYWAYDVGQKSFAIILMDQVLKYLEVGTITDMDLDKRVQKGKWICKKLNKELKLNFSERELADYTLRKT